MKNSKNRLIVETNRGHIFVMNVHYAKETPEGFWESVYGALEYLGVFDGIKDL